MNSKGNPVGSVEGSVWGRRLVNNSFALAFFNSGSKPADIACDATCWAKLLPVSPPSSPPGTAASGQGNSAAGQQQQQQLELYDVWAGTDLPPLAIPAGTLL